MQKNRLESIESAIGKTVSELRKRKKITQKEFAESLTEIGMSIDASAVSRMEKGERALKISECLMIAEALEVDLSSLLGRMKTPKQELREGVISEESARAKMGEAAWDWFYAISEVQWVLQRKPELAPLISTDFSPGSSYLEWLANNLSQLEYVHDHFGDEAYIYAKNTKEREQMLALVAAYFGARIQVDELSNDIGLD